MKTEDQVMKPVDVLFLCETNAATSLMAEALVNHSAGPLFRAFSAGRVPAATMAEAAREALVARGIATDGLEPKSWSIFALPGARRPDLVVDLATISWFHPELAELSGGAILRWPMPDPTLVEGWADQREAADAVLASLTTRIHRDLIGPALLPTDPGPDFRAIA
jgi:arsenate reductase